jgi:hypothetical protein
MPPAIVRDVMISFLAVASATASTQHYPDTGDHAVPRSSWDRQDQDDRA